MKKKTKIKHVYTLYPVHQEQNDSENRKYIFEKVAMKKRILKINVNILAKDNLHTTVLFTFTWYRLLSVDPDYIVVNF